jgi:hypothetical protein
MKPTGLWLGTLFATVCCSTAQVTVEVALDQEQFLPGEALPANVRITNRSGQTLQLGRDADWLTFSVVSRENHVVLKTGEPLVVGEFALESSKRAIKQVDLAPCFNLVRPGRYEITATVTVKDWGRQISSQPKSFDVIQGAKLWEREVGVPRSSQGSSEQPEIRRYALQQANYLKRLMLYLQISDGAGKINKVFPIGPMLSFGQPEAQVDGRSNLHILYQNGPRSFHYMIFKPDG